MKSGLAQGKDTSRRTGSFLCTFNTLARLLACLHIHKQRG